MSAQRCPPVTYIYPNFRHTQQHWCAKAEDRTSFFLFLLKTGHSPLISKLAQNMNTQIHTFPYQPQSEFSRSQKGRCQERSCRINTRSWIGFKLRKNPRTFTCQSQSEFSRSETGRGQENSTCRMNTRSWIRLKWCKNLFTSPFFFPSFFSSSRLLMLHSFYS